MWAGRAQKQRVRVREDQKPGQCRQGFEDNTEEFGQYLGSTGEPGQGLEEAAVCHDLLFKQQFGRCPGKTQWPRMGGQLGGPDSRASDTGGRPELRQGTWDGAEDNCSGGMTASVYDPA